MTDYKRFISYMYAYKNGVKTSNIGYAKIEAKNNSCKFIINVKNDNLKDKKWKIHLMHRGEKKDSRNINLIEIEETNIDKEEYTNVFATETNNVFNSKIPLQNIVGMILICDVDNYIGTEWDDNGIDYNEVLKCLRINIIEKNNELKIVQTVDKENDKKKKTNDEEIIESKKSKSQANNTGKIIKDLKNEEIQSNENVKVKENSIEKTGEPKPFIKRIFNGFPGMYPFEDDEIVECVKLEPHDLGIFPMDKWSLANNSFLLHGYYTYRHLIFARMQRNGQYKYVLGVPGIFRDREKFMAKMFGFNNFKGVRNKALEIGEFGYWYMYFNL